MKKKIILSIALFAIGMGLGVFEDRAEAAPYTIETILSYHQLTTDQHIHQTLFELTDIAEIHPQIRSAKRLDTKSFVNGMIVLVLKKSGISYKPRKTDAPSIPIPEPQTLAFFGIGLLAAARLLRKNTNIKQRLKNRPLHMDTPPII